MKGLYALALLLALLAFGQADAALINPDVQINWSKSIDDDITITGSLTSPEITDLETDTAANVTRIEALESNDTTHDSEIDALQANDTTHDSEIDALQANDTTHDSEIDVLEASLFVSETFAEVAADTDYDRFIWTAPFACKVSNVSEIHNVAGDDSGAVNLSIEKVPSGTDIGSGTDILGAVLSLKTTADTVQYGTLSVTEADYTLAAGDSLAFDFSGTLTTLQGGAVTIAFVRV